MSGKTVELFALALDLYRTPLRFLNLVAADRPLPEGLDGLLETLNKRLEHPRWAELTQELDATPEELRQAGFFLVKRLLFAEGADPHRVLGLAPGAHPARLRARYRLLMALFHPDRNAQGDEGWGENCAPRINDAYNALKQSTVAAAVLARDEATGVNAREGSDRARESVGAQAPGREATLFGDPAPVAPDRGPVGYRDNPFGDGQGVPGPVRAQAFAAQNVERELSDASSGTDSGENTSDRVWWVWGSALLLSLVLAVGGWWIYVEFQPGADREAALQVAMAPSDAEAARQPQVRVSTDPLPSRRSADRSVSGGSGPPSLGPMADGSPPSGAIPAVIPVAEPDEETVGTARPPLSQAPAPQAEAPTAEHALSKVPRPGPEASAAARAQTEAPPPIPEAPTGGRALSRVPAPEPETPAAERATIEAPPPVPEPATAERTLSKPPTAKPETPTAKGAGPVPANRAIHGEAAVPAPSAATSAPRVTGLTDGSRKSAPAASTPGTGSRSGTLPAPGPTPAPGPVPQSDAGDAAVAPQVLSRRVVPDGADALTAPLRSASARVPSAPRASPHVAAASVLSPIEHRRIEQLISRFVRTYEQGDTQGFAQLFSEDARSNDGVGRDLIADVYGSLFRSSERRSMQVKELHTSTARKGVSRVRLRVEISVQRQPRDPAERYAGDVFLRVEVRDWHLRITEFIHRVARL
jgi:hypothetical protein